MSTPSNDERSGTRSDRRLTITYYVEPQAMRRLTIPVRSANAILIGIGASLLWTFATVTYFVLAAMSGGDDGEGAETAATRYESEPAAATEAVGAAAAVAADERAALPVAGDVAELAAVPAAAEEPAPVVAAPVVEAPPEALPVAPAPMRVASAAPVTTTATLVLLQRPQAVIKGGKLKASVEIVNKAKDAASGKVWGVASFATEDGQVLEVADAAGAARTGYRAQRMSAKELSFEPPKDRKGRFVEVTITVSDARSGGESSVKQPVSAAAE